MIFIRKDGSGMTQIRVKFLSCYCSSRQYFYILATSFVPVVTRQGRGGANGRNRQLCSAQKI